jgi:hypothetical protein
MFLHLPLEQWGLQYCYTDKTVLVSHGQPLLVTVLMITLSIYTLQVFLPAH